MCWPYHDLRKHDEYAFAHDLCRRSARGEEVARRTWAADADMLAEIVGNADLQPQD